MKPPKFQLPSTPTCKVIYVRDGVNYSASISTPEDNHQLQAVMLERHVGMSQVLRIEGVQPPRDLHRGHPAHHKIVQYATVVERGTKKHNDND